MIRVLAPSGVLRAGINMSNGLLVSGRSAAGEPIGVAPDLAAAIASRLGLPLRLAPYPDPGALTDAASLDAWDIGLVGAEPQRAQAIRFTPAWSEIEATYLVRPGFAVANAADMDRAGVRIAVSARSAYGLWLERNIRDATLVPFASPDAARAAWAAGEADALAGLRTRLAEDARAAPGARLTSGRFMAVRQAVGVPVEKAAALPWLTAFVDAACAGGLVASLIARHAVDGLTVASAQRDHSNE